jgi:head-tail adaptor
VRGNPLLEHGKLDRYVTIVRQTTTTNTHNEEIASGETRVERWASMKPGPGNERFQNSEIAASAPMRFVFHFEQGLIEVTDRIEADDGRTYDVLWWAEIGRREGIEALATARAE